MAINQFALADLLDVIFALRKGRVYEYEQTLPNVKSYYEYQEYHLKEVIMSLMV